MRVATTIPRRALAPSILLAASPDTSIFAISLQSCWLALGLATKRAPQSVRRFASLPSRSEAPRHSSQSTLCRKEVRQATYEDCREPQLKSSQTVSSRLHARAQNSPL